MFLKHLDLTTAFRPSYLTDEDLLFVQDNVGLYDGKFKLPNQQDGQVYLTSHRICYVDKADPRKNSVALDLKDVERYELYSGFIKSSPKVTLIPRTKPTRTPLPIRGGPPSSSAGGIDGSGAGLARSHAASPHASGGALVAIAPPAPARSATWVCTICFLVNPVPADFDPLLVSVHTPLPACLACGIKPSLTLLLKAAIASAAARPVVAPALVTPLPSRGGGGSGGSGTAPSSYVGAQVAGGGAADAGRKVSTTPGAAFECPRCTFLNHPSLLACEMCGATLVSGGLPPELLAQQQQQHQALGAAGLRTDSPGPVLGYSTSAGLDSPESVRLAFRGGGVQDFYERLKSCMVQRKWLLYGAPPIPRPSSGAFARSGSDEVAGGGSGSADLGGSTTPSARDRPKVVGIAGLEQLGVAKRRNNELVIGNAFEDLEALMASAKEVAALAENFARQVQLAGGPNAANAAEMTLLAESATQLGLVATKDIVGGGGSSSSESLYLSELARTLAEYLTDDAKGILKRAGGIMSLVDLWARFNRARGGVELVSPADFDKAVQLWDKLKLPVRLRTFKSGVKVVQSRDRTDDTTIKAIAAWLRDRHQFPPDAEVAWDWYEFGRGVTAQDAAERFGWSLGVAQEELEMAEEKGVLCREEAIEGLKFWENLLGTGNVVVPADESNRIVKALRASGYL